MTRIVGIGLDLVDVDRFARALDRHGESFVARICRSGEAKPLTGRARVAHLAGLFAAKEAAMKALGTGWAAGIGFRQIEIERTPGGAPRPAAARRSGPSRDGARSGRLPPDDHPRRTERRGGRDLRDGGRMSRKPRFLLLALAVLALDQWTKWLVELHLPFPSSHEVIPGFFHLSHLRNTGVAFGMLDSVGPDFSRWGLSLLAFGALGLVAWLFRTTPPESTLLLTALALVLGGAAGNLLDRLFQGSVTDFLGVYLGSYRWPDFNVADSAISIGLVLLLFDTLRPRR